MLKVSLAIAEAHSKGIIHRDLKPSNIIIRKDGEPVVIDFGLAWWYVAGETRLTKTGTVLGTPHYMSPEQVNGDARSMGPGCDIYSLGIVLYELLTGRLPFEGSLASVLGKILFFEPPPPSTHRPDLDPRLEAICIKAMAKEINERYLTMVQMADELKVI
jgi:serine/threonine protein kinase